MRILGLVTACLIFVGKGWLQHAPVKPMQSSPSAGSEEPLQVAASSLQHSSRSREARLLARFLLAVNPPAAFASSGGAVVRALSWHRRHCLSIRASLSTDGIGLIGPGKFAGQAVDQIERTAAALNLRELATLQLSPGEVFVLSSTAAVSLLSPFVFPSIEVVKILTSTMGAVAATVGFSAEYTGKAAVFRGKETAAIAIETAAEAERLLASAEGTKSIIPFCVAVSVSAAAIALVLPAVVETLVARGASHLIEIPLFLVCPIACLISAATAVYYNQVSKVRAYRAVSVGLQRFPNAQDFGIFRDDGDYQQIAANVANLKVLKLKKRNFALAVLSAPIIGYIFPGHFEHKAVVIAAVAAAQCAYSLADCEFTLAEAVDAVASKRRFAALADMYANQGARAGSILPFTSSICGLCAATTIAAVEFLPYIGSVVVQSMTCFTGPAIAAIVAAAASASKVQADTNANAALRAACRLSQEIPVETLNPCKKLLRLSGNYCSSLFAPRRRNPDGLLPRA